jgi:signal peptidase II
MCLVSGWPVFCGVVMAAAALDLVTKRSIFAALGMPGEGRRIEFIPGVFVLETNLNEGALFGIGQGLSWLFATVSLAALAGILALVARPATRASRWLVVALALICGGIIGNLYDRLGLPGLQWHAPLERVGQPVYAVRDWIHVIVPGVIDWPIFNLADSWLVIGAGMLFWSSFRQPATDDRQPPSDRACPA